MAHTDARSQWLDQGPALWNGVLPVCLFLLPYPYSMFVGLVGFLALALWQSYFYPGAVLKLLSDSGFIAVGLLLIVSAGFATFRGEAYLQLAHFLPFFWFWAVLTLYLKQTADPWLQIYRWALILVLTTLPVNLIGIVEYILKINYPGILAAYLPWVDWLYLGDLHVPRAFSVFDYPNTLASYLVMILGLNLGLIFAGQRPIEKAKQPLWFRYALGANLLLTLMCLFASGSRNGYLVAILLLLVGFVGARTNRWVRLLGLAGFTIIVFTTLRFGLAGRALSWSWVTDDPRVHVWGLAMKMIRDRPLVGYGLGNYKLLYNGEVPGYSYIAHAHSFWLTLASEAGLPVMLLFTAAVGLIVYRGYRALLSVKGHPSYYSVFMGYHLSFLAILLFSLVDITLFEARVNLLAWLSLAVIGVGPELSHALKRQP